MCIIKDLGKEIIKLKKENKRLKLTSSQLLRREKKYLAKSHDNDSLIQELEQSDHVIRELRKELLHV